MVKIVIGVVGPIASGKGEVVKELVKRSYVPFSLSDRIREELQIRNRPITRENLQDVGDELRKTEGCGVLVKRTIKLIDGCDERLVVVDSIRNPEEIHLLRQKYGAKIIGVTASQERRFELLRLRGRSNDSQTWEEFLRADRRETGGSMGEHQLRVHDCLQLADVVIENDGTLTDLRQNIEGTLVSLGLEDSLFGKERL